MEQARVQHEFRRVSSDLRPGSGKIWKNQITKPIEPRITGFSTIDQNEDLSNVGYQPMIIRQGSNRPSQPAIKSLKRPISPALSSHSSQTRHHAVYKTEQEFQAKVVKSNSMLKHYMDSVKRSSENPSVLEELGNEQIYRKQELTLPEYSKQETGTQKQRFRRMQEDPYLSQQ